MGSFDTKHPGEHAIRVGSAREAVNRGCLVGVLSWLVVVPPGARASAWYDSTGPHELEGVGFALQLLLVGLVLVGLVMALLRVPAPFTALIIFFLLVCGIGLASAYLLAPLMPTPVFGWVALGLSIGVVAGIAATAATWRMRSRNR